MSRLWHMLAFFCYVTLASAVGVLGHHVIPEIDLPMSILIGAMIFLTCAVLQESMIRRAEGAKDVRRLLLLKRALDKNREELSLARDEIRRLFEIIEQGGGEQLKNTLERLTAEVGGLQAADGPDARKRAEEAAYGMLERMSRDRDADRGAATADRSGKRRRPAAADTDQSLKDASAEVRVLHNLVEQLYSGREKSPRSLSEDSVSLRSARPEPARGNRSEPNFRGRPDGPGQEAAVAAAGGGRAGLRVVAPAVETQTAARIRDDDQAVLATVREALREDRVDLYLQPIVSLPQRKRRFYECFSRVRAANGDIVGPDRYIDVAKSAGLLAAVDNMLLFRCVQLLRKLRRKDFSAAFFCNIAPATLRDREFFQDFIAYMESHSELAPNLVLEFSQADIEKDWDIVKRDLGRLGALGYRFSLDGVQDLDIDIHRLIASHFAYVKIDARIVLRALQHGGSDAAAVRALKQTLDSQEIDLIIERIETEATLVELLDFNIDYGQGYLFGEPRLSKEPAPA